jgi:hypothetical protein
MLSVSLFVIAIGAAVTIHFLNAGMDEFAGKVSRATADSVASQDNIKNLQKIQQELLANRDVIERTTSIVADSQSYEYQDQIITDLNDYANRAGISVTNIDFTSANASATTPTTPSTATPAPTGVKSTSVSITLKNPVVYENLLRFIHSIEQNLTKMQISRIGLTKDTTGNVSSEVLTIEVYIK